MVRLGIAILGSAFFLGLGGRISADPIPHEANVILYSDASVEPDPLQWTLTTRQVTGGVAPLEGSATASASNSNGASVSFVSGSADWSSPGQGTVTFGDTGFLHAVPQSNGNASVIQSCWNYRFTTQDETSFSLDYAVYLSSYSSDSNGLYGFSVEVSQDGETIFQADLDLDSADSLQVDLEPYTMYTVAIYPVAAIDGNLGMGLAAMQGEFDWVIQ
jgi:hypothetical protein